MPDGIDALVDHVKPPTGHPPVDRARAESELEQLPAPHDPMLAQRRGSNQVVGRLRSTSNSGVDCKLRAIGPKMTARGAPGCDERYGSATAL